MIKNNFEKAKKKKSQIHVGIVKGACAIHYQGMDGSWVDSHR